MTMGKMIFIDAVEEPTIDDYVLEKYIRPFGFNTDMIEYFYEGEINICENHGCMRVRHMGTYVKMLNCNTYIVAIIGIAQFNKLLNE